MSIGEFEEVGDVIKAFMSDDATVVVGTVIDPELSDEMRVTVIVTGLGEINKGRTMPASTSVNSSQGHKGRILESRRDDGTLDYHQLERPAVLRKSMEKRFSGASVANKKPSADVDYLDIPAFLRKQEEEVV